MCPWSQLEGKSASHVWSQKPEGLLKVNKINAIKHQSYCSSLFPFSVVLRTKLWGLPMQAVLASFNCQYNPEPHGKKRKKLLDQVGEEGSVLVVN